VPVLLVVPVALTEDEEVLAGDELVLVLP